jgi:hypothetical protein
MAIIKHSASLPWCYYDKYSKRILIRLSTSKDIINVNILYGDPFDFTQNPNGEHSWCSDEISLGKKYITEDEILWQTELEPPKWRRMKYAFKIEVEEQGEKRLFYFSENGLVPFSENKIKEPYDHFFLPFIHGVDSPCVPTWAANTVWYQIFPERFSNGDDSISPNDCCDWENGQPKIDNFFGGDLVGIHNKLDYLKQLGITGIYLTPVFTSPSNHKYDTSDYMNIDPHFGGKKALRALVKKAHDTCIYYGTEIGMEGRQDPDCRRPMIWNEARQDKELYKYIVYLINFRKRNIDFINKCSIEFIITKERNGEWILKYGDKFIVLKYINKKIEMETNLIKTETSGV